MVGWILVGEKSNKLKDLEIFIKGFEDEGIRLRKVFARSVIVAGASVEGVFVEGKKEEIPDFVVAGFFGNSDYHNLMVVKMLEKKGVKCFNGYESLIATTDKLKSFQMVENVLLPKTFLYDNLSLDFIEKEIGFPLVLKINSGAKGQGVILVEEKEGFGEGIKSLEVFNDNILVQEYIESSKGKDLRFVICCGEIMTSFIRKGSEDFRSNLNGGESLEFYKAPKEIEIQALEIGKSLGIKLGSVDFLFGEDSKFYFCEANSMPGLSYVKVAKENGVYNPLKTLVRTIVNKCEK